MGKIIPKLPRLPQSLQVSTKQICQGSIFSNGDGNPNPERYSSGKRKWNKTAQFLRLPRVNTVKRHNPFFNRLPNNLVTFKMLTFKFPLYSGENDVVMKIKLMLKQSWSSCYFFTIALWISSSKN